MENKKILIQTEYGGEMEVFTKILTHSVKLPDPISGAHCWLQKVRISKPSKDEHYGDIFVDTKKSFAHFQKWNRWA